MTLGVYGLVGLVAANGVLKSVDGLPLVPDLLELVGIGFSAFYVYQARSISHWSQYDRVRVVNADP